MEQNGLSQEQIGRLCKTAVEMRQTGCNIENAAYTPSNCAERTAIFKAVSEGCLSFKAIAISGGPENGELQYCPPCGVCRQVMEEFCSSDFVVYLAKSETDYEIHTLGELFPMGFSPDNVNAG